MTAHRWSILLLLLVMPWDVCAQNDAKSAVIARFQEAAALDVDPLGRLYVADAGRDVVQILDADGTVQATLGQSGTRAGEFDDPMGLDPTNGQTLLVADAGNGRIQRFSAELQYLEALPVGSTGGGAWGERAFDDGRDGSSVQGQGRPIAVASSDGDETFVIDGGQDAVVKFDAQRRAERIIGGGIGGGELRAPVALTLDRNRRLYVADAEREAVFIYDPFGTFIERVPMPPLPEIRAVSVHLGQLWIVCPNRVVIWDPETESSTEHSVSFDAPLVDAARQGDTLFLLTERRLLRRGF
jgi:DNA-binding beta-propeller fold protein YncE